LGAALIASPSQSPVPSPAASLPLRQTSRGIRRRTLGDRLVTVPNCYGKRWFQSTIVTFPTTGCWRVTRTVGRSARLSLVVLVVVGTT